jgi:hypothetical protein
MKLWLAALAVLSAPAARSADTQPACLTAAIEQVNDGAFDAAVRALDECIASQPPDVAVETPGLADAYLYKGVALVGLRQEEEAKTAFRRFLEYAPAFEPSPETFSPQVIRVFHAARRGKTKSVLDPPSHTAKKAGLSATGIAAIAVGATVALGSAAIAAQPSNNNPPAADACPAGVGQASWVHPSAREVISGTYPFQCALATDFLLKYASCGIRIGYYADGSLIGFGTAPDFVVEYPTVNLPNRDLIVGCAVWLGQSVGIGTVEPIFVYNVAGTPAP